MAHLTWRRIAVTSSDRVSDELGLPQLMGMHTTGAWRPPTDVFECEDVYVIKAAISGLTKTESGDLADAEVVVDNDTVIIHGTRRDCCPHEKQAFYRMEIPYGRFECRVQINAPFDRTGIRAQYRDGFLQVVVPKAQRHRPGTHRIQVTE